MRIAQLSPLWERVPPPAYGGIELVVSLLTDVLVKRGHDVTLFASGDSVTLAKLESIHPQALRLDRNVKEYGIYELLQLSTFYERSHEFDLIHSHMGYAALPFAKRCNTPTVHTLHGIFTPDNRKMFSYAKNQPYVSISDAQRENQLGLNCLATVYNSIDVNSHQFFPTPDLPSYLAFLGRMSPEKGPHHAITIAKATGVPLKMAGKVDPVDTDYFAREIAPHIDGDFIQFLGEADHTMKNNLMGRAIATLFPITWREPFGLVMIESMAAGTPVIGMNLGAVPEVIAHGQSGFICNTLEDCIAAVGYIPSLSRSICRKYVADRFGLEQMATGYEAVYQQVIAQHFSRNGRPVIATTA
ncbi:MAG: glycosyltransferase family 4 protein [Thermosynechococcaceae cyanobacterium]